MTVRLHCGVNYIIYIYKMDFVEDFAIYYSVPLYALVVSATYCIRACFRFDKAKVDNALQYHNHAMILASCLLLCIAGDTYIDLARRANTWDPNVIFFTEDRFQLSTRNRNIIIFQVCKVAEWIDTVFLILRRKPVIVLHWFHHGTISMAFYVGSFTSSMLWIAIINSFIHIIMYAYYARVAWLKPLAKYITQFQIVQLGGSFVLNGYSLLYPMDHPKAYWASVLAFIIACGYLGLFIYYYMTRYNRSGTSSKKIE